MLFTHTIWNMGHAGLIQRRKHLLTQGLLEDLPIVLMRFLSFSILDATHPTRWGGGRHHIHAWIYQCCLNTCISFFLIYNYIHILSFKKIKFVCFYSRKETSQYLWVVMKSAKWGTGEGAAVRPAPTIAWEVPWKGEDNLREEVEETQTPIRTAPGCCWGMQRRKGLPACSRK